MQKNYIKYVFTILVVLTPAYTLFAQRIKKPVAVVEGVVTYSFRSNGKEMKSSPPLKLFFKNNIVHLVQGKNSEKKEGQYIDYNQEATYQILTLKDGSRYMLKTAFSMYEKATLTGDTATILGYHCKKAKVIIRSNTIEIWFTDELPLKGSPSLSIAPGLGLILKTVRNGNFETYATKVELQKVSDADVSLPKNLGEMVDEATYRRKEIDNRFITIPVFNQQQINFTDSIINPENDQENVTYRYAGGNPYSLKNKIA